MKLETPFTGRLAVLGKTARTGHFLTLSGVWELKPGAVVNHAANIGDRSYFPTCIGYIERIAVMPQTYGPTLMAYGKGTMWLAELLDEGSHALSMEMAQMHAHQMTDTMLRVDAGRVEGALLVRADAFGWTGVR